MNTRKLTKLAGMSLSGLLIASFIVMSAGLLFVLAPANPVSADGVVVTRTLPDTVVPGETFEVVITFSSPHDDFHAIVLFDEAPDLPSDWTVEVDKTWCTPEALEGKTYDPNQGEYTWLGPHSVGTQFTAIYKVTVPDDALPDTYAFGDGSLLYYIEPHPAPSYTVPITGVDEVSIARPDVVWVNDDWEGLEPGDMANGYIFGYNAFATIQDGIEGAADSTVHVLEGDYDGFIVENREGLSIIGQPGAVVTTTSNVTYQDAYFMALVLDSTDVAISGLEFVCNETGGDIIVGILYVGSTGSIDGVNVIAEEVYGYNYGIVVASGIGTTVNISNTEILGWMIGVLAVDDRVTLTNCTVVGLDGAGISVGILASEAELNVEGTTIRDCWTEDEPNGGPLELTASPFGDMPAVHQMPVPTGVGVLSIESTTYITGCSKIENNDVGIVVRGGYLEVSRSNIVGNRWLGVLNDGDTEVNARANWWGDVSGPYHPEENPGGLGDEVSDGVEFYPWLDAPCPGGMPVGPAADFVGVARTGTAPLTVEFTDLSQGAPGAEVVSWAWSFGDGATSNEQHPTHTYTHPGQYTVTLAITDEFGGTASIQRFAYITVVRERRPVDEPDPARLAAFNMLVSPGQVLPNQQVEISVNIGNSGGLAGTREVNLYINGHFEDSQTVTVPAGSTSVVLFTVARADPGTYYVSVDGHEGQFTVMGTPSTHWGGPIGTGGIIAIIVVVIALAVGLVFVFRRQ